MKKYILLMLALLTFSFNCQAQLDMAYFRNMYAYINHVYSNSEDGAKFTEGLGFTLDHRMLYATIDKFKDFDKKSFLIKANQAKQDDGYKQVKLYVETVEKALADYPNFINKSNSTFRSYLGALNEYGIKGDVQKELEQLKATKALCTFFLQMEPNHPKATKWSNEVDQQIAKRSSSISFASNMHEKYMGKILFSKKEVSIGSESEGDFTTDFSSGDHVFATVYLPSKLRKLTDSYAANDVLYTINGSIVEQAHLTPVWVTTAMQENNYLQFAIIPDATWKSKYSSYYIKNKLRTHENIITALVSAGEYSGTEVEVKIIFRGSGSSISGKFEIDLSGGLKQLEQSARAEENARLRNTKLPQAGMVNADLENQALTIMSKKSGESGKTYTKAIITSPNWDYDKSWAGITVSRSIVIALVSKEHDGKCMFQYFNFLQQGQGGNKYNRNLEFAGSGMNKYISCDNL